MAPVMNADQKMYKVTNTWIDNGVHYVIGLWNEKTYVFRDHSNGQWEEILGDDKEKLISYSKTLARTAND